jgi:hypothetical protein
MVEGIPFVLEETHHGGIEDGGIAWTKGHYDTECVFLVIGSKKCKLFMVILLDCDLVVASLVVETDEKEVTSRVTKVFNDIVVPNPRMGLRTLLE